MTDSDDVLLFVSHHSTQAELALAVEAALAGHGIKCWIAPRDVPPGEPFDRAIQQAIERATGILLLLSRKSDVSRHVKRELILADSADKPIIPLRLELMNPQELRYLLADSQWIDWTEENDQVLHALATQARFYASHVRAAKAEPETPEQEPETGAAGPAPEPAIEEEGEAEAETPDRDAEAEAAEQPAEETVPVAPEPGPKSGTETREQGARPRTFKAPQATASAGDSPETAPAPAAISSEPRDSRDAPGGDDRPSDAERSRRKTAVGVILAVTALTGGAMLMQAQSASGPGEPQVQIWGHPDRASAGGYQSVRPSTDESTWITASDYPDEAIRQRWTAFVEYRLTVDPSGRVSNCYISRISSYQVFNSRTCQLLEVHARFEPARNASGTTVEASYSGGVLWDFRR